MIRLNKFISSLASISFLINTVISDLAFSQQLTDRQNIDTLAAPLMTDDILGIGLRDRGLIGFRLEEHLATIIKEDTVASLPGDPVNLADWFHKRGVEQLPDGIHIFFSKTEPLTAGLCVEARINDEVYGLRRYYAVFSPQKDENGLFPVTVYTEAQYNDNNRFRYNVPAINPDDAREIARYVQHERGVDTVIREAHEQGLARAAISSRFKYHDFVKQLFGLMNITVTYPLDSGLKRIEDREFYLVKLTDDEKDPNGKIKKKGTRTKIAENPAIILDKDGNEHRVEYRAHSSNNAVHVFVDEDTFELLTNPDYELYKIDGLEDERLMNARQEVANELYHELGVPLGLQVTVADDGKLWNKLKERAILFRRDASFGKARKFKSREYPIVNLDHIRDRDYAAGRIVEIPPHLLRTLRIISASERMCESSSYYPIFPEIFMDEYGSLIKNFNIRGNIYLSSQSEDLARQELEGLAELGLFTRSMRGYVITEDGRQALREFGQYYPGARPAKKRELDSLDHYNPRTRPGKSPADARKLINASLRLQGLLETQGYFTLNDYLAANPKTTARDDLAALAKGGMLVVDESSKPYRYSLAEGYRPPTISGLGVIDEDPSVASRDHATGQVAAAGQPSAPVSASSSAAAAAGEKVVGRVTMQPPGRGVSAGVEGHISMEEWMIRLTSLASEVGQEMAPPVVRYNLLVTSEFFASGEEFKEHQARYADGFNLGEISGIDAKQFVTNTIEEAKKVGNNGANTIALVPDTLSKEQLKELVKAGIRFIRINVSELQTAKLNLDRDPDADKKREAFQIDTFAIMLLARHIAGDKTHPWSASVYGLLSCYLDTHFNFTEPTDVYDYVEAIAIDNNADDAVIDASIARLIKGHLLYSPIVQHESPDYHKLSAALVSA